MNRLTSIFLNLVAMTLLAFPNVLIAGGELPDNYLAYSTLIKLSDGSSASGFFYGTASNVFLVTARHVLFQPGSTNLNARSATITYFSSTNEDDRAELQLDLSGLRTNNLIRCHPTQDVCIAHLGRKEGDHVIYNNFVWMTRPYMMMIQSELTKYTEVPVSSEIFVFGYPSSIGIRDLPGISVPPQIDYNLPLLRKGIVAGKNPKNKTIILDSPTYFGNSGGPVLLIDRSNPAATKFSVIGVISEFVPFVERIENKTYRTEYIQFSNSGYCVVAPADCILETVW